MGEWVALLFRKRGGSEVQSLARRLTAPPDISHAIPYILQANSNVVPQTRTHPFPSTSFAIHVWLITPTFDCI
jgi:hypothetical protein